jgi:hypothetical protein
MILNSYLMVDKIVSNTQLVLREKWAGTTMAGIPYTYTQ